MRRGASPGIRTPVVVCTLLLLTACGHGGTDPGVLRRGSDGVLHLRLGTDGLVEWRRAGARSVRTGMPNLPSVLDGLAGEALWRLELTPDVPWRDVHRVLRALRKRGRVVFEGTGHDGWTYATPPPAPRRFDGHVRAWFQVGHADARRVLRLHVNGSAWVQRRGCEAAQDRFMSCFDGWGGDALAGAAARLAEVLDVLDGDASRIFVRLEADREGPDAPTASDVLDAWVAVRELGIEQVDLAAPTPRCPTLSGSVDEALRWLAAHQSPNGRWASAGFVDWCDGRRMPQGIEGAGNPTWDVPATALAILAFLGAGYTDHGRHPFGDVVRRGLDFLEGCVEGDGGVGGHARGIPAAHAMVTLALLEGFRRTGREARRPTAAAALAYLPTAFEAAGADPLAATWTACAIYSVHAATHEAQRKREPLPFVVPDALVASVRTTLEALEPKPGSREAAMALLGRVLLGEDPRRSDSLQGLARGLEAHPPGASEHPADPWRRMFGTHGMFHVGGRRWKGWSHALRALPRSAQEHDGPFCCYRGSWRPREAAPGTGGLVAWTAACCIGIEVYYRFASIFCAP